VGSTMTTLSAALVTPLSGPLAQFGIAGAAALRLWATRAPGLPAPWSTVDLQVVDAYPSAAAAMRSAVVERPNVLFGPYGTGPALAALSATPRAVWNHGGATSRLRRPAFAQVLNVLAPASTYFVGVLQAIRAADAAARRLCLLTAGTSFGQEVAHGAAAASGALGFDLWARVFTPGQVAAVASGVPAGDVLLVAGGFEDERAAARLLLGRRWRAAGFVAAGVDEVLSELGALREGLLGPAQWVAGVAEPVQEGPDAAWFVSAFRDAVGSAPPYPAVAAFAAGVLAARCLRDAGGAEDAAVLQAAMALSVRTLFGDFRLDPETGAQAGHQVLVVQWQAGVRRVVWPLAKAERPIMGPRTELRP